MAQETSTTSSFTNPFVYLRCHEASGIVTYWVSGDTIGSFNKKDCEWRIRQLCNAGQFSRETRNILLDELKALKRP